MLFLCRVKLAFTGFAQIQALFNMTYFRNRLSRQFVLRLCAVALHVFLLVSSYPPYMSFEAAWFAMIPPVILARYTRGLKRSFCWGWAAGAFFWLINLLWLLRLAETGGSWIAAVSAWAGLSVYCGIYTGCFVMLLSRLFELWIIEPSSASESGPSAMGTLRAQLSLIAAAPLIWVGLEYARGTLFSGFPWNCLGVTQFRNIGLIQAAAWGGVYAVSALIIMANMGASFAVLRFVDMYRGRRGPRFNIALLAGVGVPVIAWYAGLAAARDWLRTSSCRDIRIVAIQPAVPQSVKWEEAQALETYEKLEAGTRLAVSLGPELVIWPETACPDLVNLETGAGGGFPLQLAGQGVPILAGAIEYSTGEGRTNFFNSSVLYLPDGTVSAVYRKMHLVPFGEYLPFESVFPSLASLAPLGFSCSPGDSMTVFTAGQASVNFSALICFEDIFPGLSRLAVKNGARLLVNQTNDAWFDYSAGSVQHLANAVFRAVENRVPMVRCANSGVSCFIDPLGRLDSVTADLIDESGSVDPDEGIRVGTAAVPENMALTFYQRHGDIAFALPSAAGTIIVIAVALAGQSCLIRKKRGEML